MRTTAITPLEWVNLLYHESLAPEGFVEFRLFSDGRLRDRQWMQYPAWEGSGRDITLGKKTRAMRNVYYGVALRRGNEKGERADCLETHLVWVELDLRGTIYVDDDPKAMPPLELRAAAEAMRTDVDNKLEDLGITPRAIIYSGHGLQYLIARKGSSSVTETEAINRWLAQELLEYGADTQVWNIDRILRVPGTLNLKNPARPLEVELWHSDQTAITSDSKLGKLEAQHSTSEQATYNTGALNPLDREAILEKWRALGTNSSGDQPGRHYLALNLSGWLKNNGWTEQATVAIVAELAREADDDETPDRTRAARDTYRKDTQTRGWHGLREDFGLELQGLELKPMPAPPIKSNSSGTAPVYEKPNIPKRGKAVQYGYNDYRDMFLDHLAESGQRIAHLEQNDSWWIYDGGVYKPMPAARAWRMVDRALEEHDLGDGQLKTVMSKLARADGIHREHDELGTNELNCANGVLDLDTLELREHTPDVFHTVQTAADWDELAEPREWLEFLSFAIPQESERWLVQQYAGYALTADTSHQVALFLVGEGSTGKGTIARTISSLLGGAEASSLAVGVSFEALEDGGHHLSALLNKRLAVISEMNRTLDWLTFKRITGEDNVLIDEKYKTPFSARLSCKLLMLSNTMPHLGDDSTNMSILRRLMTIEMNRKPETPDTGLEARLTAPRELSGVLTWAVAGLHSLREEGGFKPSQNNFNTRMAEQSNRVITWASENCDFGEGLTMGAKNGYDDYREWAGQTGHRSVSSSRFRDDLISAGKHLQHEITWQRSGGLSRFSGVALRRLM